MGIMKINGQSLSLFGILEQVYSGSLTAACKQTHGAASKNPCFFFKRINQSVKKQQLSADLFGVLQKLVFIPDVFT
jgi:hypothetical protein